jgi:hypothetical protein
MRMIHVLKSIRGDDTEKMCIFINCTFDDILESKSELLTKSAFAVLDDAQDGANVHVGCSPPLGSP